MPSRTAVKLRHVISERLGVQVAIFHGQLPPKEKVAQQVLFASGEAESSSPRTLLDSGSTCRKFAGSSTSICRQACWTTTRKSGHSDASS